MLESTRQDLLALIPDDALVLDIGGWGDPFERADWNLDIGSYDTRGLYERAGWAVTTSRGPERFTSKTWVQRDICAHEPFPFNDDQFDFVICSHTLEDIRDPVWVCNEIARVGKAGYIETPSRLEEQSWGVIGPFVGHPHHHWIVESDDSGLTFTFKPHHMHCADGYYFPAGFHDTLADHEKTLRFRWQTTFTATEHIPFFAEGEQEYFGAYIKRELDIRGVRRSRSLPQRVAARLRR